MQRLLLLLPLLAIGDPWLLYYCWNFLGTYGQAGVLFVYPLLATLIVRSRQTQPDDPFFLASRIVRTVTRVLIWYPGLLCKISSAILLFPAVEKGLGALIMRKIQKHFLGDLLTNPALKQALPPAGLKPSRGRVVK